MNGLGVGDALGPFAVLMAKIGDDRRTMTDEEILAVVKDYNEHGWILVALPPDIVEIVVDKPATQMRAFELSDRIKAALGG